MYTRDFLLELRRKAIRRRVWYTCLDRVDRGIFYLVTRVVDRIESATLGVVILKIAKKLRDAMKSSFVRLMESDGFARVGALVDQALGWGSTGARGWLGDEGFARFLTVLEYNAPSGWGV